MRNRFCLEVCVESVEHARAAERGGADRIEVCTDLSSGGITPSLGFMQTVRRHVRIPIHALVRPRAGDFCYSHHEFEIMREDIAAAKHSGMSGVVVGILHRNMHIDVARTKILVELAHPLPVTFHRAFDESANQAAALEEVIETGASRILTSAGKTLATDSLSRLKHFVEAARGRIVIMPCGGINDENVLRVLQKTSAREIHSSLGASDFSGNGGDRQEGDDKASGSVRYGDFAAILEQRVAKLVGVIGSMSRSEPVR
jgi:copper homeostasis protein